MISALFDEFIYLKNCYIEPRIFPELFQGLTVELRNVTFGDEHAKKRVIFKKYTSIGL